MTQGHVESIAQIVVHLHDVVCKIEIQENCTLNSMLHENIPSTHCKYVFRQNKECFISDTTFSQIA